MSPVRLGDMTPEELDATVKRAVRQFQDELDRTAPAIAAVLNETEDNPE